MCRDTQSCARAAARVSERSTSVRMPMGNAWVFDSGRWYCLWSCSAVFGAVDDDVVRQAIHRRAHAQKVSAGLRGQHVVSRDHNALATQFHDEEEEQRDGRGAGSTIGRERRRMAW